MSLYLSDEILLPDLGAPPGGADVHGDPRLRRICVDDGFRFATITASSTLAGHPAANVADGLTYDFWRPAAGGVQWVQAQFMATRTLNYMAVAAHDLHKRSGTATAQVLDGVSWVDAADPFTPTEPGPFVIPFDDWVTTSAARLKIEAATAPYVGVVYCGRMVAPPHGGVGDGMVPFRHSRVTTREGIWSDAGASIGQLTRRLGAEVRIDLPNIAATWFDTEWLPLLRLLERYPFFVVQNLLDWGLRDVIFGTLTADPRPAYGHYVYQSLQLQMMGITE